MSAVNPDPPIKRAERVEQANEKLAVHPDVDALREIVGESVALAADVRQLVEENGMLRAEIESAHIGSREAHRALDSSMMLRLQTEARCDKLTALWEACQRYCQHVPEIAERAAALGLLPPREDKLSDSARCWDGKESTP